MHFILLNVFFSNLRETRVRQKMQNWQSTACMTKKIKGILHHHSKINTTPAIGLPS